MRESERLRKGGGRALGDLLRAQRRGAMRSNRSVMRKLIGGAAYKELTVRNLNTALKLKELLAE